MSSIQKNEANELVVTLQNGDTITTDVVISAIGREANVDGINLQATNIQQDSHGNIQTDDFENTSVNGVYALGDVNGKI
eukprot:CAMPEP_0168316658 /NCGR_PEP_ID=MMETSP0210-20121227/17979_1 /TAXON_ID=40633 /ORGANISM="Condylostoma magnum, Strain COL2" /LENGTH=78 /DNA_ID=CAMNT_0008302071 /DNA_START=693 /DNA_END=929 /DNA_ORIENTATION=+